MLQSKPIPPLTLSNIIPPNTDYAYFQDSTAYPFEWDAQRFSMTNAWWLAEIALLTYAEESFARRHFEAAGFKTVRFFRGQSTQCYFTQCDDFAVLAFRGTESDLQNGIDAVNQFIADLKTDLDFLLVNDRDEGEKQAAGKIHRGFNKALDEVWADVLVDLKQSTDRPLWITGHSLGGALATLAAARYHIVKGLYTYGSPRVGDDTFGQRFHVPAFRFVNHNDVVTKVPPRPYRHIGHLVQFDSQGRLVQGTAAKKTFLRILQEKIAGMKGALRTWKPSSATVIPEGLQDHAPLLYALHTWNNLVANH